MFIAKFQSQGGSAQVGLVEHGSIVPLILAGSPYATLAEILDQADVFATIAGLPRGMPIPIGELTLLPPIDHQEVWAAGVTYKRSQTARMEESEAAASCYDRVYRAARPELFFKATPHRVRGHLQPLRIRRDATWNVPEPEVTLVLNKHLQIVGLTIGNDMSSRDIEGENPLYLPQAKCYDASAGLGPWIWLTRGPIDRAQLSILLVIRRQDKEVFRASTSAAEMAREFEDLVGWLGRDNPFPQGAFLMTGTGVVPNSDFTLAAGDWVDITIQNIGTLSNPIIQG